MRTATPKGDDQGSTASTPLEVRFAHAQLSRNRRALIRAILENHEQAYFLSSRELAKRYKVDAATVVRAITRRYLAASNGRPRCSVHRLSHTTRSYRRHACR